jgi:hypothetical protein
MDVGVHPNVHLGSLVHPAERRPEVCNRLPNPRLVNSIETIRWRAPRGC